MSSNCNTKSRVLFILKFRRLYNDVLFNVEESNDPYSYFSSGLLNSARQVDEMLNEHSVESKLVQVVDNNSIDKEVHDYRPTDVIIEALWVVPEKFEILQKLHPTIRWIIRLHSETPFAANEGIFTNWVMNYIKYQNVYIGVNSPRLMEDLKAVIPWHKEDKLIYLPNYYDPIKNHVQTEVQYDEWLNVGCFGAVRPLKNSLLQAMAAIKYAKQNDRKLKFHINATRVENNGDNVLKNIRGLFINLDQDRFQLVEHPWLKPGEFSTLLSSMDLSMQVSLSETYNIVSAGAVAQHVPIVVSREIPWASRWSIVEDANDINSIVHTMNVSTLLGSVGVCLNKRGLHSYNKKTVKEWLKVFK